MKKKLSCNLTCFGAYDSNGFTNKTIDMLPSIQGANFCNVDFNKSPALIAFGGVVCYLIEKHTHLFSLLGATFRNFLFTDVPYSDWKLGDFPATNAYNIAKNNNIASMVKFNSLPSPLVIISNSGIVSKLPHLDGGVTKTRRTLPFISTVLTASSSCPFKGVLFLTKDNKNEKHQHACMKNVLYGNLHRLFNKADNNKRFSFLRFLHHTLSSFDFFPDKAERVSFKSLDFFHSLVSKSILYFCLMVPPSASIQIPPVIKQFINGCSNIEYYYNPFKLNRDSAQVRKDMLDWVFNDLFRSNWEYFKLDQEHNIFTGLFAYHFPGKNVPSKYDEFYNDFLCSKDYSLKAITEQFALSIGFFFVASHETTAGLLHNMVMFLLQTRSNFNDKSVNYREDFMTVKQSFGERFQMFLDCVPDSIPDDAKELYTECYWNIMNTMTRLNLMDDLFYGLKDWKIKHFIPLIDNSDAWGVNKNEFGDNIKYMDFMSNFLISDGIDCFLTLLCVEYENVDDAINRFDELVLGDKDTSMFVRNDDNSMTNFLKNCKSDFILRGMSRKGELFNIYKRIKELFEIKQSVHRVLSGVLHFNDKNLDIHSCLNECHRRYNGDAFVQDDIVTYIAIKALRSISDDKLKKDAFIALKQYQMARFIDALHNFMALNLFLFPPVPVTAWEAKRDLIFYLHNSKWTCGSEQVQHDEKSLWVSKGTALGVPIMFFSRKVLNRFILNKKDGDFLKDRDLWTFCMKNLDETHIFSQNTRPCFGKKFVTGVFSRKEAGSNFGELMMLTVSLIRPFLRASSIEQALDVSVVPNSTQAVVENNISIKVKMFREVESCDFKSAINYVEHLAVKS